MFYYNREGQPIDRDEAYRLFEDRNYKVVACNTVDESKVSTVWLGINHGFSGDLLIFETMIFSNNKYNDYQERYRTEQEALRNHKKIIKQVIPVPISSLLCANKWLKKVLIISSIPYHNIPLIKGKEKDAFQRPLSSSSD